jgi:hypothetical protein
MVKNKKMNKTILLFKAQESGIKSWRIPKRANLIHNRKEH